jgi:hypothetical protein
MPQKNKASREQRKAQKKQQLKELKYEQTRYTRQPKVRGQLSAASFAYTGALYNPRSSALCCVPNQYPPIPSFKVRTWIRGTSATGTVGWGSIIMNPLAMCKNDATGVYDCSNNSTFNGTMIASGVETGVNARVSNAPFAAASISSAGTQARVVAAGLYVWFQGADVDCQGEIMGYSHTDNEAVTGYSQANLLAQPTARRAVFSKDRKEMLLVWLPTRPSDVDYTDLSGATFSMGVLYNGAVGKAGWVGYDAFVICEYAGGNTPSRTMSMADPEGFSAVLTAAEARGTTALEAQGSAQASKGLVASAKDYLSQMSGPIADFAGRAIGSAAKTYMGYEQLHPNHFFSAAVGSQPQISIADVDKRSVPFGKMFKPVRWDYGRDGPHGKEYRMFDSRSLANTFEASEEYKNNKWYQVATVEDFDLPKGM